MRTTKSSLAGRARRVGVAGVASVSLMVAAAACSSSGNSTTATAGAAGQVGAAGSSSGGDNLSAIKTAPQWKYCGSQCDSALELGVAPASVNCKVAFVNDATSFDYGAAQMDLMEKYQKQFFPNMHLVELNGNNDPVTESHELNTVVLQGYKVVILDPVLADAMVPATRQAVRQGVKIISIDREVNTPVLTTIKAPDVQLGETGAQYAVDQMHGKGNVVILSGTPGASPTISRTQGFMNVLKKYPNVHVLENVNGNYTSSGGLAAVSSILARYGPGQVNWILSEADNMVQGAFGAIESAHRQGTVHFLGINGSNSAMNDLGKDGFDATVVYPVVEPEALTAAAKACNNEPMPTTISLEAPLVTTQNVAEFKGTNY